MASRRELLMKANQANSSRIKLQKNQETIVDAIVNELEDTSTPKEMANLENSNQTVDISNSKKENDADELTTASNDLRDSDIASEVTKNSEENVIQPPENNITAEQEQNLVESKVNVTSIPPINENSTVIDTFIPNETNNKLHEETHVLPENIQQPAESSLNSAYTKSDEFTQTHNDSAGSSVNHVTEGIIERKKRPSLRATEKMLKDRKLSVLLTESAYANVERFTQELGYRSKNDFLNTLFERLDDIIE